ncbi:hypothetical protein CBS101457_006277 [Exobasidium rhododendri]|nr:hypothetical protein CBS101457_006277 [Exobasidium rhododendri]
MAPVAERASQSAERGASSISRWAEANKNLAIALGLGTIAVGGAGVYYFLNGPATKPHSKGSERIESPEKGAGGSSSAASKKKKSKKSKKVKEGTPPNEPQVAREGDDPLLDEASIKDLMVLSEEEIKRLPEKKRKELAQALKAAGNKSYQSREFENAIGHYTKAIAADPLAVFFSNRAACYSNLNRPQDVIPDCNRALSMDHTYIKALNRRAVAREQLGGDGEGSGDAGDKKRDLLFEALADFTAVAILGQFKDQTATESVERVLKKIANSKAKEILRTREPKLPSPTFVTAYLDAFRPQSFPDLPEDASQGDKTLILAYEAVAARNYPHAFSLFNEAVEQGLSNEDLEAAALNMRGTFKFVIGNAKSALDDLERSTTLRPKLVQSWVKKASVHMELSDKDEAFNDFDIAIKANPNDPDIYYHRGQVHFILGDFDLAIKDYLKSTELDDTFIFSQVQYAVALYKTGKIESSTKAFKDLLEDFEGASEAYNYFGELLLDQSKFKDALQNFDKAIQIENEKERSSNVLPMINKALALFQWKQEMGAAETLCRSALDKDPDCDVAVATLAQLSLQQGKIKEAIEYFERSAQIARTEPELINAITYENASRAQLRFIDDFPEEGKLLQSLAGGLSV